MSDPRQGWQPKRETLGDWTAMFDDKPSVAGAAVPPPATSPSHDDADAAENDDGQYRPWTLQRGRSPAALLLGLRWFDAKAGLWHGCAVAYPSLYAIDSIGDRMVSLDFGTRQFVIEGHGLDELARHLQQGTVVAIHEYAATIWPNRTQGPVIIAIKRITAGGGQSGEPGVVAY